VLSYRSINHKETLMTAHPLTVAVLGAGPVGSGVALALAERGHMVRVLTRSGSAPKHQLISAQRVDVVDSAALTSALSGVSVVVNALNPPYTSWPRDWPPMHRSIMTAARATGAAIVMMDNLYGYGDTNGQPMSPSTPDNPAGPKGQVRADMARELLAAHRAGDLRVAIARGSDFIGPTVTDAVLGDRAMKPLLKGGTVRVLGDPDAKRSWAYTPDVTALMTRLVTDQSTWGRVWHVPSPEPISTRGLIEAFGRAAGTTPKISAAPPWLMNAMGIVSPMMRELRETAYQFSRPFLIDDSATRHELGLTATSIDTIAVETIAWWRTYLGQLTDAA
jgi:nucleoside-diphosphate-sugar epimerase